MSRTHDLRRIKTNRTYTYREICELLNVSLTTIWKWSVAGLPVIDHGIPRLIHGIELKQFLICRRKPKQPLQDGQIYCVACREPRRPEGDVVTFVPRAATNGDLVGNCPCCHRRMHRRVRARELSDKLGSLHLISTEHGTTPYGASRRSLQTQHKKVLGV